MKRMTARYNGTCRVCGGRIRVGDRIFYGGKRNLSHETCGAPNSETPPAISETSWSPKSPTGESVFTVDWANLKSGLLGAFRGDFSAFPKHRYEVESHLVNPDSGWQGYTGADTKRWLEKGFHSDAIKGLGDFSPPLRKKRRIRFQEEGDEFHYDLAASGDENFMSTFTERERIPGASVQIALGFSAGVPERILNEYARWVCKAIYALIMAGIDPEIMIHYRSDGMVSGFQHPTDTRIRVKKEGEVIDFLSFSPMLSPAQFRAYMFCAMYQHCESLGRHVTSGHGYSSRYFKTWGVRWDSEKQKLYVDCDYSGSAFPESKMESDLRQALRDMTRSSVK